MIPHNMNEKLNRFILSNCMIYTLLLGYRYGHKMIFRQLLGIFVMFNVWLLARWCSTFDLWYPVDKFTVYLLVWQFSYLIFQWCSHQLSWPRLIFYQAAICIFTAAIAFICHDLVLRYFPSIHITMIWYICFIDV